MNQKQNRASKNRSRASACAPRRLAVAFAGSASAAAPDTTRVIVAFKPGAKAAMKSVVAAAKGSVKHEIFNMNAMAIEVPTVALKGLENNPNVEYIEEDVVRKPFSLTTPSTGTPYTLGQQVPYGIKLVQADQLPDTNTANRKVCIIDSGVDFSHEDLKDNGANVTGEYDSGTGWWYTDETHHGTHVFGTIAGVNNGTGVVGVNPNKHLKLHIVKVFGNAGAWTYSSTLASAANKCGAAGANVITMSLGGGAKSMTEQKAFDSLQTKGVLSIAAAGNDGNATTSYPAGYTSVMSVAAVDENKVGPPSRSTTATSRSRVRASGAVERADGQRPGSGPDGRREHLRAGAWKVRRSRPRPRRWPTSASATPSTPPSPARSA
jgi:subtilisin family serine protease